MSSSAVLQRSRLLVTPAYVFAVLVFGAHLALGANREPLALGLCCVWLVGLAVLLITTAWARDALSALRWVSIGAPFGLLLSLTVLSMTPYGIAGSNPVWHYLPSVAGAVSLDPDATRIEAVKLCALAAIFIVGSLFGSRDEQAKTLLRAVLALGAAFSAWVFVDHILWPNQLYGAPRPFDPGRLSGPFGSANTAATLFGALTLLNLADLMRVHSRMQPSRRFNVRRFQQMAPQLARPMLGLALAATCLVLTLSRTGLVATLAAAVALLALTALLKSRPARISGPLIAIGLVVVAIMAGSIAINSDSIGQRFGLFGQDSLTRGRIFAIHLQAFQAAPWSGYGLGSFARVNAMIMNVENLDALDIIGATHNVYIQWLEEAGIVGACAMLLLVTAIAIQLVIGAARNRAMRSWILAIIAVLTLFAVHGVSDYALQTPSMAAFLSLLLGVAFGLAQRTHARPGSDAHELSQRSVGAQARAKLAVISRV